MDCLLKGAQFQKHPNQLHKFFYLLIIYQIDKILNISYKMKKVKDGKATENRFRSGETIEIVRVETKDLQYLYEDGTAFVCMDSETYDQVPIEKELFDTGTEFLMEGDTVKVSFDDITPLGAEAPNHVELEITYTEPGIKGNTATNATKPAIVETGAKINVPLFINEGDKIRIDTDKGNYQERVKE